MRRDDTAGPQYVVACSTGVVKRKREDKVSHQPCKGWYESGVLSLEVVASDSYTGRQMAEFKNSPNLCMRAMKQDEVQKKLRQRRKGEMGEGLECQE